MFIPNAEYHRIQELLPILCVDVVITYQGKCLLLKRLNHPAKGQWWFPGGRVLKNETIQQAAGRKCQTEVGLNAIFKEIITIEETIFPQIEDMRCDAHTVNICCHLVVDDIKCLRIDADHDGFDWFGVENVNSLNLHSSVLKPLINALNIQ